MESFEAPENRQNRTASRQNRTVGTPLLATAAILLLFVGAAAFVARAARSVSADPPTPAQLPFVASTEELSSAGALWLDTSDPDGVAAAFLDEFSKPVPEIEWRGSHETCDGGSSSAALRTATIARVNYYRAMAGVSAVITENQEYSALAQSGALMMSAEGKLSHQPPTSFACFSETGFEAASNSNLYLGRTGVRAIDGYIEDPGAGNTDVGHRNTLLHPPTEEMGVANVAAVGDFDESNLVWVFDELVFVEDSPTRSEAGFVAWPPPGYVPREIVHPRWSFSLAGASFEDAKVRVFANGAEVEVDVVEIDGKIGRVPNPIIVWELQVGLSSQAQSFEVEVSNVDIAGQTTTFRYTTIVMQPLL